MFALGSLVGDRTEMPLFVLLLFGRGSNSPLSKYIGTDLTNPHCMIEGTTKQTLHIDSAPR